MKALGKTKCRTALFLSEVVVFLCWGVVVFITVSWQMQLLLRNEDSFSLTVSDTAADGWLLPLLGLSALSEDICYRRLLEHTCPPCSGRRQRGRETGSWPGRLLLPFVCSRAPWYWMGPLMCGMGVLPSAAAPMSVITKTTWKSHSDVCFTHFPGVFSDNQIAKYDT